MRVIDQIKNPHRVGGGFYYRNLVGYIVGECYR